MTRLLLLGTGPLPADDLTVVDFPRLRTWHFLRGLLEAGHEVCLVASTPAAAQGTPAAASSPHASSPGQSSHPYPAALSTPGWQTAELEGRKLELLTLSPDAFDRPDLPARWLEQTRAAAVVSAGPFAPARAAARIPPGVPVWIDLPGDPMAEAQLRAASSGDPSHLSHAYRVLSAALARGDAFSVTSDRQRSALLGQLAFAGRFTAETVGWEGVSVVPVALEPAWKRWAAAANPALRSPARVLWPGAINTWADVDTFFEACTRAMARRPDLEAVVTGGPIAGHEEQAWHRLKARIDASPYPHRWRLTGWIDPLSAAREVCEATVGLSLDRRSLEATLGSRTRLLYGLAMGLPWITTPGCELADRLISMGLARGVPVGDPQAVCDAILEKLGPEPEKGGEKGLRTGEGGEAEPEPGAGGGVGSGLPDIDPLKIMAETRARVLGEVRAKLLHEHEGKVTLAPLLRWIEAPVCTPPGVDLTGRLIERVDQLEKSLAAIHHSPTWRVLGALHGRLKRKRGDG